MIFNVHAGHGAANSASPGASGYLNESVEDRRIKDAVISRLRTAGHTAYDCTVDYGANQRDILEKIVVKCNSHDVDYDISIHLNAFNGTAHGTEVCVHPLGGVDDVAQRVVDSIAKLGFKNRGLKVRTDLYFLNKTKNKAFLIETCFCDNAEDYNIYNYNADAMADAIVSGILGASPQPTPQPQPTPTPTSHYDAYYAVKAGKIYPEVKNTTDYAGVRGRAITDMAVRISSGSVEYRVHVLGGNWLPWVNGYDWNDYNNGYAGNGKAIDGIQIKTGSDVNANIQYRVSPVGQDYLPWVTEDSDYAGIYGRKIDRVQIKFDR